MANGAFITPPKRIQLGQQATGRGHRNFFMRKTARFSGKSTGDPRFSAFQAG